MNKLQKIERDIEEFYSSDRDDSKVKINAYTELRADNYEPVWYVKYKSARFMINDDRDFGFKYLTRQQRKEFNEFIKGNQPGIQWGGFVGPRPII